MDGVEEKDEGGKKESKGQTHPKCLKKMREKPSICA
jgi:hypothetical protein